MLVLVTGGAGFIGSHLVDALLSKGYDVRILDAMKEPVHPEGRIPDYLSENAEVMVGNIRDKSAVMRALDGVGIIFHEAAHQGYFQDYSTFFDVNSTGTAMLFEAIAEKKQEIKKIIIASSQAVYGEGQYFCREHGEFKPATRPMKQLMDRQWEHVCPLCGKVLENRKAVETSVNPNTQYAMSKYTQEMIGLNLGLRHQIPVVCLRYSIVLGRRQSFYNMYTGILRSFSTQLMFGRAPVIFEDGLMLRDYVHIDDVVDANMCVLENPGADYQSFNVGSGVSTSVLEFYREVAEVMGSDIRPFINGDFRVGDVRHIVSSVSKLEGLGWRCKKTLRNMIGDYIEYLNTAGNIKDVYASAIKDMQGKSVIMKSGLRAGGAVDPGITALTR